MKKKEIYDAVMTGKEVPIADWYEWAKIFASPFHRPMNIPIVGPPGVGKGTHGKEVARKTKATFLEASNYILPVTKNDKKIMKIVEEVGGLVPDDIALALTIPALMAAKCSISDSFQRTIKQAKVYDFLVKSEIITCPAIIHYEAEKKDLLARIAKRAEDARRENLPPRKDDDPVVFEGRYETYLNETLPAIKYLRSQGYKFYEIDGRLSEKEASEESLRIAHEILKIEQN